MSVLAWVNGGSGQTEAKLSHCPWCSFLSSRKGNGKAAKSNLSTWCLVLGADAGVQRAS